MADTIDPCDQLSSPEDLENEFLAEGKMATSRLPERSSDTEEAADPNNICDSPTLSSGPHHFTRPMPEQPTLRMRRTGGGGRSSLASTVHAQQHHTYSTSNTEEDDEEEAGGHQVPAKGHRRRRRRRRKMSSKTEGEEEAVGGGGGARRTAGGGGGRKSSLIEAALLGADRDRLAQLAVSHGGLLSDEIRVRVWPRLMGISMIETDITLPSDQEITQHPEYNQVVLDVNRSLKRFPPGIGETERPALQEQLTRLILRVIIAHPHLHYYQGYHDVAITFLLVVGEELGYQIVERLSISHLQDFMFPTMERTVRLLQYMYPIFRRRCPELCRHLERAELGTIFALPWLITWFGHVLPDYNDVVRLYDFFLAQPPLMPIYLAAAIVLHRKNELLQADCDMATIHSLLSRIPQDLPFEDLLVQSQVLYEEIPPHSIKEEVESLGKGEEAVKGAYLVGIISKFVIYTAPVVVGFIFFRLYASVQS